MHKHDGQPTMMMAGANKRLHLVQHHQDNAKLILRERQLPLRPTLHCTTNYIHHSSNGRDQRADFMVKETALQMIHLLTKLFADVSQVITRGTHIGRINQN